MWVPRASQVTPVTHMAIRFTSLVSLAMGFKQISSVHIWFPRSSSLHCSKSQVVRKTSAKTANENFTDVFTAKWNKCLSGCGYKHVFFVNREKQIFYFDDPRRSRFKDVSLMKWKWSQENDLP